MHNTIEIASHDKQVNRYTQALWILSYLFDAIFSLGWIGNELGMIWARFEDIVTMNVDEVHFRQLIDIRQKWLAFVVSRSWIFAALLQANSSYTIGGSSPHAAAWLSRLSWLCLASSPTISTRVNVAGRSLWLDWPSTPDVKTIHVDSN